MASAPSPSANDPVARALGATVRIKIEDDGSISYGTGVIVDVHRSANGAEALILTCGHLHISGYQVVKDPSNGLVSHALRVASYKKADAYADARGLNNQHIFCAPVTILDPRFEDDDPRLVTTLFDPESAADYLTWLRARWARGSRKR